MVKKNEKQKNPTNFTKYEKARIIGSRALQISMGAPYLVKLSKKELEEMNYNPVDIALTEFEEGSIPISVLKPLPKIKSEKKS